MSFEVKPELDSGFLIWGAPVIVALVGGDADTDVAEGNVGLAEMVGTGADLYRGSADDIIFAELDTDDDGGADVWTADGNNGLEGTDIGIGPGPGPIGGPPCINGGGLGGMGIPGCLGGIPMGPIPIGGIGPIGPPMGPIIGPGPIGP